MTDIRYHSRDTAYKTPFGALRRKEECSIFIEVPAHFFVKACFLCISGETGFLMRVPMQRADGPDGYARYGCTFCLPLCGLYFYNFYMEGEHGGFEVSKTGDAASIGAGDKWQITCFDEHFDTPDAFKGRVYYQIFPDRFAIGEAADCTGKLGPYTVHKDVHDMPVYLPNEHGEVLNNDFFGGNLSGIRQKLPYLRELGVGVLYLNPIFMAFSSHRYDTADYMRIDPMLGTEEDFKALCDDAHKLGMQVVMDCAFSHTGSDSVYFDKQNRFGGGAYHDPSSRYRSWYQFTQYPHQYTSWWGIETLPCVNEMDKSYLDYIIWNENSVVAHYLALGADGIRLDVADELPDEFIAALKARMRQLKPGALLIGEVWEDASNKISYGKRREYFTKDELDSVMNYPFRTAILDFVNGHMDAHAWMDSVGRICENYPKPVLDCVMNSLSTHDTIRVINAVGDVPNDLSRDQKAAFTFSHEAYKAAILRVKLCAFLQFMLPGCACIYYGDEIGMDGFEDPFNRQFYRWDRKDEALFAFYKTLAAYKNTLTALKDGAFSPVFAKGRALAFSRTAKDSAVIAAANAGDAPVLLPFSGEALLQAGLERTEQGLLLHKNGFLLLKP